MDFEINRILYKYLIKWGLDSEFAVYINALVLFLIVLILVFVIDYLSWKVLRSISARMARKTKTNFDNLLVANKAPRSLAHILPLLVIKELIPIVFVDFPYVEGMGYKLVQILGVMLILRISRSLLNTLRDYFKTRPRFKDKPIDSYIQVFMIFAWTAGLITVFAIITGVSVWKFFTALGAASAVILLIFKDSILGLVASIQVTINDMLRIGDWITFERYGADGDVIEINLATVKVQNFDKTITTIPTYALISDSFKNWRGMSEAGGRRIKRALILKQDSIKYLAPEEVEALKKIELIADYLDTRQAKIAAYNSSNEVNTQLAINGRNLTNIGVFRKYIEAYLEQHPAVNKDMILMARQLSPTAQGIPIEIYAFSSDKRWENYEYITADIFDHLLAAVSYFDLALFELPSSSFTISST